MTGVRFLIGSCFFFTASILPLDSTLPHIQWVPAMVMTNYLQNVQRLQIRRIIQLHILYSSRLQLCASRSWKNEWGKRTAEFSTKIHDIVLCL